jgi:hypothetical protein
MKYVISDLNKGKKIFVPASHRQKGYYRFDPRNKKVGEPFTAEEPKKNPPSMKSKLIEGLMQGIAEGMEEALKDVKGVDEKMLQDAVKEVKANIMENLGGALKKLQATESEESEPKITVGGEVVHEPKGYAKQYAEKLEARKKETEQFKKSVEGKAINFLADNPFPPDKKIHELSDRLKIETDEFEAKIYGILSDVIEHGKGVKPNLKELSMGIKVESEHTKYPELARWIALAHLKEIPDYYSRLKKMEKEAKRGSED